MEGGAMMRMTTSTVMTGTVGATGMEIGVGTTRTMMSGITRTTTGTTKTIGGMQAMRIGTRISTGAKKPGVELVVQPNADHDDFSPQPEPFGIKCLVSCKSLILLVGVHAIDEVTPLGGCAPPVCSITSCM